MKKILLLFCICLLLAVPIFSQTAAEIETLLETEALSYEQAASFVLRAADVQVSDSAFNYASEQKWLPKNAAPEDTARLNGIALLLMRSFELKGGIFYSLAKSPHHAYRELVYKGFIQGDTDPGMPVSGRQLLLIISRILSVKEKDEDAQI